VWYKRKKKYWDDEWTSQNPKVILISTTSLWVDFPSPNTLDAYQLKGSNPSKRNNECLKPKSEGLAKAIKEYQKARKGFGF